MKQPWQWQGQGWLATRSFLPPLPQVEHFSRYGVPEGEESEDEQAADEEPMDQNHNPNLPRGGSSAGRASAAAAAAPVDAAAPAPTVPHKVCTQPL